MIDMIRIICVVKVFISLLHIIILTFIIRFAYHIHDKLSFENYIQKTFDNFTLLNRTHSEHIVNNV